MDKGFIERAEKITSFNITVNDLQSTDFKSEIRHLFEKHYFSGYKPEYIKTVDSDKLNNTISKLKDNNNEMFFSLHNYNLKGIGPGEMMLYFLVDSAQLGGGSSSGIDIIAECGNYEVKAAYITKDNVANNFKLGGTVSLSDLIIDLEHLKKDLNIPGSDSEISGAAINTIREKAPDQFKQIEDKFKSVAYDYFGSHKTIFINHNKNMNQAGHIAAIKNIDIQDINIERVTSGTIKPRIRL